MVFSQLWFRPSSWHRVGGRPVVLVVGHGKWLAGLVEALATRGCWVSAASSLEGLDGEGGRSAGGRSVGGGSTPASLAGVDVAVVALGPSGVGSALPVRSAGANPTWVGLAQPGDVSEGIADAWDVVIPIREVLESGVETIAALAEDRVRGERRDVRGKRRARAPLARLAPLHLDEGDRGSVWVGDARVRVSSREWTLLRLLLNAKGRPVSRETLMAEVWGAGYEGTPRVLDVRLADLRRKLRGWGGRIEAVRGIGYRLLEGSGGLERVPASYSPGEHGG
jgi:hypothetical protein